MLRGIIFSIILLIKHYLNKYLSGPDILFGDLYSRSRIFWEFLRIESFDDWDVKDLDQMEEDSWNNSCIYDTRKKISDLAQLFNLSDLRRFRGSWKSPWYFQLNIFIDLAQVWGTLWPHFVLHPILIRFLEEKWFSDEGPKPFLGGCPSRSCCVRARYFLVYCRL